MYTFAYKMYTNFHAHTAFARENNIYCIHTVFPLYLYSTNKVSNALETRNPVIGNGNHAERGLDMLLVGERCLSYRGSPYPTTHTGWGANPFC
jgi:hypothetical protein